MDCGRYDSSHGSKTFGDWIKCGTFVEIGRIGKGSYPTIEYKCPNCGKMERI